ncbi:hypothetical protein [Paraburkholderia sp. WC7.3d]
MAQTAHPLTGHLGNDSHTGRPNPERAPGVHARMEFTIDPQTYLAALVAAGATDVGPLTRCPLCQSDLAPARGARHAAGAAGHLRHKHRTNDAGCVLTTSAYQPKELVAQERRDVIVGGRHREHFIGRWTHHYVAARRLLPSLTVQRFATVIAYADVLNLWSCAVLQQEDVPVVLLVLAGFMRLPNDANGAAWVRFWFDTSVQEVEDLWKPRPVPPRLFQVAYREPEFTPFPTGMQVLYWNEVASRPGWLDGPAPELSPAEMAEFRRFVARGRGHLNRGPDDRHDR